MTFTLDTSGSIYVPFSRPEGELAGCTWIWSDLDPFTQGYIEALLRDVEIAFPDGCDSDAARFRDLAGETLDHIRKDCAAANTLSVTFRPKTGRAFWEKRQAGFYGRTFPPLTPYLGDDGKVYLRAAA